MAFPPNTVPPTIRAYNNGSPVQPTDAFVIDRIGVGTMYVTGLGTFGRDFLISGLGSVITSGVAGNLYWPSGITLAGVTLTSNESGSIVIDIWKVPRLSLPAASGSTIVASTPPTISGGYQAQDNILSGWTKTINADDVTVINVRSVSGFTEITLTLTFAF